MKMSTRLLVLPFALLTVFGAGCGSRAVVQAPPAVATPATTTVETSESGGTPTSGWNPIADQGVTSTAIAYVSINGEGALAQVQRDGEVVAAADGEELVSGDRVTVTRGSISLIYPQTGETRLTPGSDVTIISDSSSTSLFAELRLTAGRAWTRFERIFGNDEHFSVAANGVVATVRGTAFGVSVVGDQADVQVADHAVEVSREGFESQGVRLAVGEGMRLRAAEFVNSDLPTLKTRIRKLTVAEQTDEGFAFARKQLAPERLRVPVKIIRPFRVAPIIRPELRDRLNILRSDAIRAGFLPPNRGLLNTEISPILVAPSSTGPAIR